MSIFEEYGAIFSRLIHVQSKFISLLKSDLFFKETPAQMGSDMPVGKQEVIKITSLVQNGGNSIKSIQTS